MSSPIPTARRVGGGARKDLLPFRTVRPSVLDLRFTGDPWVEARGEGGASLCLDGYQLTTLAALAFDLPTLNRTLCRLRRPPARN